MENQTQLAIFIAITFVAILLPAIVLVINFSAYRRRILEKEARIRQVEHEKQIEGFKMVVEAEEKEREKMAKNLHDGIIPALSVIKRSLDNNALDYGSNKYNLESLKTDINTLEQTIVEIRGVSHDLVPPSLMMYGAIKALEHYIKYVGETGESEINFEDRTTFGETMPLPIPEQHNVYRICLELLHNLHKYAHYKSLHIIAGNDTNYLKIEFIHDGRGISNEEIETLTNSSSGLGLKSLKSRASILNATIDYSYDSQTAGIVVTIPLKQ
jgi:two-component system NarL family sensor kinase